MGLTRISIATPNEPSWINEVPTGETVFDCRSEQASALISVDIDLRNGATIHLTTFEPVGASV